MIDLGHLLAVAALAVSPGHSARCRRRRGLVVVPALTSSRRADQDGRGGQPARGHRHVARGRVALSRGRDRGPSARPRAAGGDVVRCRARRVRRGASTRRPVGPVRLVLLAVAGQVGRSPERTGRPGRAGGFRSSYVEPSTGAQIEYGAERVGLGLDDLGGGRQPLRSAWDRRRHHQRPDDEHVMGVPFRVAVTTSTYMLGATAAASCARVLRQRAARPYTAAPVALGIIAGAQIGSRLGSTGQRVGPAPAVRGPLCRLRDPDAGGPVTPPMASHRATRRCLRAGAAGRGHRLHGGLVQRWRRSCRQRGTCPSARAAGLVRLDPACLAHGSVGRADRDAGYRAGDDRDGVRARIAVRRRLGCSC